MKVEVISPDANVGDVLGDLNARRAQIEDAGGMARRDPARRSRGGRRASSHRLRDIVAAFATAGAQGVDGGDVR
jgi:hypothetical protein